MAFKLHPDCKKKGKIELTDKKVITGEFRISYPHLKEPKEFNGKTSYSTSMIFSKDVDISDLEIAAHNAAIEKWGSDTTKWPGKKVRNKKGVIVNKCLVKMPFKDGDIDKPDKEEYENTIFLNASNSKNQPQVIDQKKRDMEPGEVRAGDYYRASLIAFAYEGKDSDKPNAKVTSWGVSFSLLNLQKLRTGEPLGGGMSAAAEFDEVDEEEADDINEESEENEEESEEETEEEDEEETPPKKSSKTKRR